MSSPIGINEQEVVLVDEHDRPLGFLDKLEAHRRWGKLHRAVSVFVFNFQGELMMQQRADTKYHSGGLWSNTCCSHPRRNESVECAAHRCLKEEMGFDCDLEEMFSFVYSAPVGRGLTEREFDHVLFGTYDGSPRTSPREAKDWKWMAVEDLRADLESNEKQYTTWLRLLFAGELLRRALDIFAGKVNSQSDPALPGANANRLSGQGSVPSINRSDRGIRS